MVYNTVTKIKRPIGYIKIMQKRCLYFCAKRWWLFT